MKSVQNLCLEYSQSKGFDNTNLGLNMLRLLEEVCELFKEVYLDFVDEDSCRIVDRIESIEVCIRRMKEKPIIDNTSIKRHAEFVKELTDVYRTLCVIAGSKGLDIAHEATKQIMDDRFKRDVKHGGEW